MLFLAVKQASCLLDLNGRQDACSTDLDGKLSPEDAYKQIHGLWKELTRSKKKLNLLKN